MGRYAELREPLHQLPAVLVSGPAQSALARLPRPGRHPFGLLLAVLIDRGVRFSRFYQSTLYMPVVLSLAVVGFIAQLVFSRDQGALNAVIGDTDSPTDWLGDPDLNIWMVLLAAAWRHTGYVMILYLAGLKAVDPSLKEAAAIDGAGEAQTFFRIVLPTLRPVNVIVGVITVIESLRAFDIVYAVNHGRNGLELLSVLVTDNIIGEAKPDRLRLRHRRRPAGRLPGIRRDVPGPGAPRGERPLTVQAAPARRTARRRIRPGRIGVHAFLMAVSSLFSPRSCSRCTRRCGRTTRPPSTATSRCRAISPWTTTARRSPTPA